MAPLAMSHKQLVQSHPDRPLHPSDFHMKGWTDELATRVCKYVAEHAAAEGKEETHIWAFHVLEGLCGKQNRLEREVCWIQGKKD